MYRSCSNVSDGICNVLKVCIDVLSTCLSNVLCTAINWLCTLVRAVLTAIGIGRKVLMQVLDALVAQSFNSALYSCIVT